MQTRKHIVSWAGIAVALALVILLHGRTATTVAFTSGASQVGSSEVRNLRAINIELETLAKSLAQVLATNKAARVMLQQEILKQPTGDYEVLYSSVADMKLAGGSTLRTELARVYATTRGVDLAAARKAVDEAVQIVPSLHIAVPVNFEKWNAEKETLLVGYGRVDMDDMNIKKVAVFDAGGKRYDLDAWTAPTFPVAFVGPSERTDEKGNVLPAYLHGANHAAALSDSDPLNNSGRGDGALEILLRNKITDLREPWWLGKPEIWLKIQVENMPDRDLVRQPFYTERSWQDVWVTRDRPMFNWYRDDYGDFAIYYWYESDGGWPMTVRVCSWWICFEFTIQNFDDQMGHVPVHFNDPDRLYSTGQVLWYDTWVNP